MCLYLAGYINKIDFNFADIKISKDIPDSFRNAMQHTKMFTEMEVSFDDSKIVLLHPDRAYFEDTIV